jgi:hypothetical protein
MMAIGRVGCVEGLLLRLLSVLVLYLLSECGGVKQVDAAGWGLYIPVEASGGEDEREKTVV